MNVIAVSLVGFLWLWILDRVIRDITGMRISKETTMEPMRLQQEGNIDATLWTCGHSKLVWNPLARPLAGLGFYRIIMFFNVNQMECEFVAANTDLSTPYIKNLEETGANILNSKDPKCLLEEKQEESESGISGICDFKDDDLLISAILKNKSFKSMCKHLSKRKSLRRSCKLSIQSSNKGVELLEKQKHFSGQRTVLSWLIYSEVLSLGEVIQYRRQKTDTVLKEGIITRKGVLCRCCKKVLSISEFNSHAGFRLYSPCSNLYMESGKPFTLCLLEAWSVEYKARKGATQAVQIEGTHDHDDNCGHCGDRGDLICCDNCTSAFHKECLNIKKSWKLEIESSRQVKAVYHFGVHRHGNTSLTC